MTLPLKRSGHGFVLGSWRRALGGASLAWALGMGAMGTGAATPPEAPAPGAAGSTNAGTAQPPAAVEAVKRAMDSQARGLFPQAVENLTEAIALLPRDARLLLHRAQLYVRLGNFVKAEADLTRAVELEPAQASLFLERGILRLRMAEFAGSVADLERFSQMRPSRAAELWQLGIAQFYAGRADDGRRLFELHRTVNAHDVENSAWHFACMARVSGVEAARRAWLPVTDDPRVPMAQIQALMTGKGNADEVLAAAEAVTPQASRESALLYAHLYLSLYYGAQGRSDLEARHAAEASKRSRQEGMMGEIARLHADWVTARLKAGAATRVP